MTQIRFPNPVILLLGALLLLSAGCSDDDPTEPQRPPMDFLVGVDFTLAEAVDQARPGDTISFFGGDSLSATQIIPAEKTPLLIRPLVLHDPVLRGPGDQPILRFESPAEGTRIVGIHFQGGSSAIQVQGGQLEIEFCGFREGGVQVLAGGGAVVDIGGSRMDDAAIFSIQATTGARIASRNNTIVNAGDCGILITGNATGMVNNSIIHASVNYGIACTGGGSLDADSGCNDIFASGTSSYLNCVPPSSDFSLDPAFCDVLNGYYRLSNSSPCRTANSPGGCGLVGFTSEACSP